MAGVPGIRAVASRVRARWFTGRALIAWRVVTAVALIALGLSQLDLEAVGRALRDISIPLAVLSWALLLAGQCVSGLRWGAIAERYGARSPRSWFVRAYLRGCFYNVFLPTGIGGDAMRVALLRHDIGLARAGRSVVVDRVSGLAALLLCAGAALPLTPYLDVPPLDGLLAGLALVATAAASVALAWRGLGRLLAWTALYVVVWLAGMWVLAEALHISLDPLAMPMVAVIVGLAIALPVSIGGTGTREASMAVAIVPLGATTAQGVALGVCFGVVLALVGLVGAPLPVGPHEADEAALGVRGSPS